MLEPTSQESGTPETKPQPETQSQQQSDYTDDQKKSYAMGQRHTESKFQSKIEELDSTVKTLQEQLNSNQQSNTPDTVSDFVTREEYNKSMEAFNAEQKQKEYMSARSAELNDIIGKKVEMKPYMESALELAQKDEYKALPTTDILTLVQNRSTEDKPLDDTAPQASQTTQQPTEQPFEVKGVNELAKMTEEEFSKYQEELDEKKQAEHKENVMKQL